MKHVDRERCDEICHPGRRQLYRMDFREMMRVHRESKADATVAIKAVPAEQTAGFGIMKTAPDGRIVHFEEKPKADRLPDLISPLPGRPEPAYLASMGIYIFSRRALRRGAVQREAHRLRPPRHPGHAVAPAGAGLRVRRLLGGRRDHPVVLRGQPGPDRSPTRAFSFYDAALPHLHPPALPGAHQDAATAACSDALIADGCFIEGADIESSVIGIRSRIGEGVQHPPQPGAGGRLLRDARGDRRTCASAASRPSASATARIIDGAIIDKNARIGRNVRIVNEARVQERDAANYYIREGIVIVPKGAVIPDGTVI